MNVHIHKTRNGGKVLSGPVRSYFSFFLWNSWFLGVPCFLLVPVGMLALSALLEGCQSRCVKCKIGGFPGAALKRPCFSF